LKVIVSSVGVSLQSNCTSKLNPLELKKCENQIAPQEKINPELSKLKKKFDILMNQDQQNLDDLEISECKRLIDEVKRMMEIKPCAEIDTIDSLKKSNVFSDEEEVKVILLHGLDLTYIAKIIQKQLKDKYPNFEVRLEAYRNINIEVENKMNPENLVSLWKALDKIRIEAEENDDKIIMVASGGFKMITDILYIYGILYRIPVYYKYEKGEAVRLPELPVNWDYVLFVLQSPSLKKGEESFWSNIFDDKDFQEDLRNKLPYLEPVLKKIPVKNKMYKKILEDNIAVWQDLWIGDLIPETVEHSKSHSKRLLQRFEILHDSFGGAFFDFLGINDEEDRARYLFYLYASAYLHDIGHTVLKAKNYDFVEFPDIVREYHNVLSVYEMERSKSVLGLNELEENDLVAIKLICLYHRKKMGLTSCTHDKNNDMKSELNARLMGELLGWKNVPLVENEQFRKLPEGLQRLTLQVAAMLKFLDELDVQADRTVSESYKKVRLTRLVDESQRLLGQIKEEQQWREYKKWLEDCLEKIKKGESFEDVYSKAKKIQEEVVEKFLQDHRSVDPDLRKLSQVAFKLVQFGHFEKHSSVNSVIPVWEKDKGLYIEVNGDMDSCKKEIESQVEKIKKDQDELSECGVKLFPGEFSDDLIRPFRK